MTAPGDGSLARFRSFDGRELAYLDAGPPGGPLALLLHGFASSHDETWVARGVVAALAAAGRRVVAPDARGHGRSARPHDAAAYGDHAMERDVGALLDDLGVEAGAGGAATVDVVGYSMGSVVAACWAGGDRRVRSVVLGGVGDHIADGSRAAVRGRLARYLAVEDPSTIRNGFLRSLRREWEAKGCDCRALAAVDEAGQDDPTPAQLAALGAVPVLVLTGADDSLVGSPSALADRIPGARARTVPGDHPDATASPEFAAAVVEFVTGAPAPTPSTDPSEVPAP